MRIKRNPFSRIVYDIFSISIWMSKEIKNHSPSPGLLFSDDGVRFVKKWTKIVRLARCLFFSGLCQCMSRKGDEGIPGKIVFFFPWDPNSPMFGILGHLRGCYQMGAMLKNSCQA